MTPVVAGVNDIGDKTSDTNIIGSFKKKKNLRFQVKKSNNHFAEGLMVFTRG